ncbi:MAG: InlB B-repeat-containing protein [Prevotella sp.]|nr:InlB B-repeat-containing protein [Prevotella sp.]
MKRIRYLTLLAVLLCSIGAWAQDDAFHPDDPAEPGLMPSKLTLVASPSDGGTVSKSGAVSGNDYFTPGQKVSVRATASTGWKFVKWTDASGTVLSTNASFTNFTKGSDSETLTAHFEFAPTTPAEPSDIEASLPHRLTLVAEEGGTVSGGGRYVSGTSVSINATTSDRLYQFAGWYNQQGQLVSETARYSYVMGAEAVVLTARFDYVPDSPDEPDELKAIYTLKLTAEEGGSVSASPAKYRLQEGATTTIRATTNSGYQFKGWYLNGGLYTENASFTYTMGAADVEFVAHFKYVPDDPSEPAQAEERKYSFTLYNVNCKPGDIVDYPVYLTSQEEARDITFQLSFDNRLTPDLANIELAEQAEGYTIERTEGTALEGNSAYVYTLSGGTLPAGNVILMNIRIPIPADMATGQYYPVTINQISVTRANETTQTAAARNGRVSVYKLGDTNGDNSVNATDVLNIATIALDKTTEVFIGEVSDINEDGKFDATDVLGIATIALQEE